MSPFSRNWSLRLDISREEFIKNFYKVIQPSDTFILETWSFANDPYKDFFGHVESQTFNVYKRNSQIVLNGEFVTNGAFVDLDLTILNNMTFNYFTEVIIDIVLGFVMYSALVRFLTAVTLFPRWNLVCTVIILAFLGYLSHRIQMLLIKKYLDNLQANFEKTLLEIESVAKSTYGNAQLNKEQ